ncbi:hypothetical protein [Microcystis phage Mwe-JY31]
MKQTNIDRYSTLIQSLVLVAFHESEPGHIHPDELNDVHRLSEFFYALAVRVPAMMANDLSNKQMTDRELHELTGELLKVYEYSF